MGLELLLDALLLPVDAMFNGYRRVYAINQEGVTRDGGTRTHLVAPKPSSD